MNAEPFVIERVLNAPVSRVWRAITDKEEMKQWYFDIAKFKLELGCEFEFTAGGNGQLYVHLCKITEIVPEQKLAYSWRYEGYEGNSIVTWELFPEGEQTKLKLTHTGLETFPQIGLFARENFVKGWTSFFDKALLTYLQTKA